MAFIVQVFGEVLGHALGQHGDERAVAGLRGLADLADEVVDLGAGRADLDGRIDEAGGADHLLDEDALGALHLPRAGRGRDMHGLRPHGVPFLEAERAVVHAGGQPEAVFGERGLAPKIAAIHAADLRHRDVALVGEHEGVVGQVFEQGGRRLAGAAAGEVARIVLDALAGAGGLQHLEVEGAALLEPLRLEQAAGGVELLQPLLQLLLDGLDRLHEGRARRDVMRVGVDLHRLEVVGLLAGERVELDDALDLVAEEGDAPAAVLVMGREQLHRVAAHPERAAGEIGRALVLQGHEVGQQLALVDLLADLHGEGHGRVGLDRADAVDAGHGGDDDDVVALQQRARGRMAHAVDLLVDGGFLLDIGVRARHVGLGLVVVVVGDEVFHGVVGEEALELAVELRRQRLVGREDQGRALGGGDDLGHREGLAGAGDAEQHLVAVLVLDAFDELLDGGGLVALRLVFGTRSNETPPSDFSGRGGRCGTHSEVRPLKRGSPDSSRFFRMSAVAWAPEGTRSPGSGARRRAGLSIVMASPGS